MSLMVRDYCVPHRRSRPSLVIFRSARASLANTSATSRFDRSRLFGGLADLNPYIVLGSVVVGFLVGMTGREAAPL